MDNKQLIEACSQIARAAGSKILAVRRHSTIQSSVKSDGSPLSEADTAANTHFVEELTKISSYPIVSEENTVRSATGQFWLIDPLDGTKDFLSGGEDFTVNIALITDGQPKLGIVYAPCHDVLYVGDVDNQLAYKVTDYGTENIQSNADKAQPIVLTSKLHKNERTVKFLQTLPAHIERQVGSSLKICLVAEGSAMMYPRLGQTSVWDTAAADAVLRAAGGSLTDFDGNILSYQLTTDMLNPLFIARAQNNTLPWQV